METSHLGFYPSLSSVSTKPGEDHITLTPGVYAFSTSASMAAATALTFDAQGDPNAVFIIQVGTSLVITGNTNMVLANGARACNVFWRVGTSATIAGGSNFIGTLSAGTSITVAATTTVDGRLWAGNDITLAANTTVKVPCVLTSTKTPNVTAAKAGDVITYTVTITNNSPCGPMTITSVVDTKAGTVTANFPTTVPASSSVSGSYTYTVQAGDPNPLNNLVTVNATFTGGTPTTTLPFTSTAAASVPRINPDFTVTKTADKTLAQPGDIITYTVTLTNTGDVALNALSVTDSLLGPLAGFGTSLAPAATVTKTFQYVVQANDLNPLANTVTVTATPQGTNTPISKTASSSVPIVHPGLLVTKVADVTTANPGDVITYTVTIKNTGDVNLNTITVADPLLGGTLAGYPTSLAPGISASNTFTYTVLATDPNPLVNTVTFTATPRGLTPQSTTGSASVVVVTTPGLLVTKIANVTTAKPGDIITYTITITNTGAVTLNSITVTDPLLGGALAGFPSSLAAGASASKTFDYTVQAGDPNPLTNTATFTATPEGSVTPVSATSTANVTIVHPAVTVTKVPDTLVAKPGDIITYTITVKNTGDVTLDCLTVTDTLLGPLGGFGCALAPGVSVTRLIAYTVQAGDPNPLLNSVTIEATPHGLAVPITASTTASVVIFHPSLTVTKTANRTVAYVGSTITYTITITNTGDAALNGIVVSDPQLGGTLAGFPTTLLPGAAATQTFDYLVTATDVSPLVNTVTFSGIPRGFTTPIVATASASVPIAQPSIAVTKATCEPFTTVGGTITYLITIQNTGTVRLDNIVVTDPVLGGTLAGFPSTLAPGEAQARSFTYVVQPTDPSPLINTVTVTGTPDQSQLTVTATASVQTTIVNAELIVIKEADRAEAQVGDKITYTISVKNTGAVPLKNLVILDTLLGPLPCIATLAPGASQCGTFCYTVKATDPCMLVNLVRIRATVPGLPGSVTATGTATTRIIHPAISITKTADKTTACVGETISYTITIKNTGDVKLTNVEVKDALLCVPGFPGDLAPCATACKTFTYVVKCTDPNPLVNTVCVRANTCGCNVTTVTASASACVKINQPQPPSCTDLYIYNACLSTCVGYRVYGTTGENETISQAGNRCTNIQFPFMLANTGTTTSSYLLRGDAGINGWQIRYYDPQRNSLDITAQITGAAGYTCNNVAPSGTYRIMLIMTPGAFLPCNAQCTVKIGGAPTGSPAVADVIKATCTAL